MAQTNKRTLKFNDKELRYHPVQENIRRFDTYCRSKGIQNPYSVQGFESIMQSDTLRNEVVNNFKSLFDSNESLAAAYESCVNHAFREHGNPYTGVMNTDGEMVSMEGYGATATNGNYNVWTRLTPMLTAGYLARARSLELYQIYHDDKPTFWRQYTIDYAQKGLEGKRFMLPKAIRSGAVAGLLDLPEIVMNTGDDQGNIEDKEGVAMIKAGTSGNLFEQGTVFDGQAIQKGKHSLQRSIMIDWIHVKFAKGGEGSDKTENIDKNIRVRIERKYSEGKTSEVVFNQVVAIPYKRKVSGDASEEEVVKYVRVMGVVDLDTGNYHDMSADVENAVTHVHYKVRVTNVANEFETLMNGQDHYVMSFSVEDKVYCSIPIVPEMTQDFNAAGDGVSWVSYMTDKTTETYAGIRDNDLENTIAENFDNYSVQDFELYQKLGGYKTTVTHPIIPRQPGGSDDILAPQRFAMKHLMTRIFTRAEKSINFEHNIERQWIVMANDEDCDILPEVTWTTNSATLEGGDSGVRYGFSLDDAYGWSDNFGRKVRVIGSRDERWLDKPMWMVMKSLNMEAPTTIYFPYMFRAYSSISADLRNRPAIYIASRDVKRVSTMVQARLQIEGNNLSLYSNSAAFAAGLTNKFTPLYDDNGNTVDRGSASVEPVEGVPNISPDSVGG